MTPTVHTTYDVFVANGLAHPKAANEIAAGFQSAGMLAFHEGLVQSDEDVSDAIWEALAESHALIAIISADSSQRAMGLVEIGAAEAWTKPIYLVISGPSSTKLPAPLSKYPVFPMSRLDEVIHEVRSGFEPLTKTERSILAKVYQDLKTPVDKISYTTKSLHKLKCSFNERTHKRFSGERLLSELMRMRKSGLLPRLNGQKLSR